MRNPERTREAIRPPGRSEARATGALWMAGAGLVALSLVLPHPDGADTAALIATAAAMLVFGAIYFGLSRRAPLPLTYAALAGVIAVTAVLIAESGIAAGQYGTIYVWALLITAYFFPRRIAFAYLAWLLLTYAISLSLVESTAGYSPLTRWLFSAISLSVVVALISSIVASRDRADVRARRFFDLSQDMLCTLDPNGRCVEANGAWEAVLGYGPEEMRGKRLLDFTHPEDHEAAREAMMRLFDGGGPSMLETRVQAKDGSWHWLRSSSTLAPDEGLIYARSTDVTELKRIASEREELLAEVEDAARRDVLTGLPNRRALDEALPGEMARARRGESPLCLALIDIDHFKAYNDGHGHLAGDEVLRECAIAWVSELRGEDTIVRFGGEEFLVVLPDCPLDQAAEIVERLRGVTPGGQTCSAGLAQWDFAESVDALLSRADAALYEAKESGRDLLVAVPVPESV
ncbi:MAG TPA: sensor domain-containing diguanylate cyclase [Solirubrobacterales bacterium]|nr:sensor domain-containing diguanylate cyclase [Solirubrobacterales bacterium]